MVKPVFTNKAIEDLSDIWEYTLETWSEKQADRYYKLLVNACLELAQNPGIGKSYFEIYPELYGKRISKHIIFYRILSEKRVEINRILHDRMDLENRLEEE